MHNEKKLWRNGVGPEPGDRVRLYAIVLGENAPQGGEGWGISSAGRKGKGRAQLGLARWFQKRCNDTGVAAWVYEKICQRTRTTAREPGGPGDQENN